MSEENKFYVKVDDTENSDNNYEDNIPQSFINFIRFILKLLISLIIFIFPVPMFFLIPIITSSINTP